MNLRLLLISALCFFTLQPVLAQSAITIRAAGQYAIDHQTTILFNEFSQKVEELTGGEVKIRSFPANQLGDYTLIYDELRMGTIDMAVITIPSQHDTRLEVIYLHYLAKDYEEVKKIYAPDSNLYSIISNLNATLGVKFLGFNAEGFGGIGAVKMPQHYADPSAKKGILLRVPPMVVFQQPISDAGYSTVSLPFAELYTALQTGVADGWSGGPAMVNYIQFRDVIKYYIVLNNYFECTSYLMSQKTWKKLTPDQQRIIQECVTEITRKSFLISEQNEEKYLSDMQAYGIEVIRFNQGQLKAWADHCRKMTWPKLEPRLTRDVLDSLLKD